MAKGKIHSFETFGAADGPGVRFMVFLSGCPLRCAYCHNPDTWARPAAMEMEAEEVLEKALSLYPDDQKLNAVAGQRAIEAGDIDKAIKCFQKAGESAEVMNNLGGCYLIKGDVENAAKCYDKAKELSVAAQNAQELKELKINQKYFNK